MPTLPYERVALEKLEFRSTTERATFRLSLARSTRIRWVYGFFEASDDINADTSGQPAPASLGDSDDPVA